MAVPTLISQLSTVIASNVPAGSESPATLDEYQRAHAAFIAQLYSGPAFRAVNSTTQTIATNATNKLVVDTETFDTAACYDNATNYRFTPTVAGYYLIASSFTLAQANHGSMTIYLYKNGSSYASRQWEAKDIGAGGRGGAYISELISFNGSTDYVETYAKNESGGSSTILAAMTSFHGHLARLA